MYPVIPLSLKVTYPQNGNSEYPLLLSLDVNKSTNKVLALNILPQKPIEPIYVVPQQDPPKKRIKKWTVELITE